MHENSTAAGNVCIFFLAKYKVLMQQSILKFCRNFPCTKSNCPNTSPKNTCNKNPVIVIDWPLHGFSYLQPEMFYRQQMFLCR